MKQIGFRANFGMDLELIYFGDDSYLNLRQGPTSNLHFRQNNVSSEQIGSATSCGIVEFS